MGEVQRLDAKAHVIVRRHKGAKTTQTTGEANPWFLLRHTVFRQVESKRSKVHTFLSESISSPQRWIMMKLNRLSVQLGFLVFLNKKIKKCSGGPPSPASSCCHRKPQRPPKNKKNKAEPTSCLIKYQLSFYCRKYIRGFLPEKGGRWGEGGWLSAGLLSCGIRFLTSHPQSLVSWTLSVRQNKSTGYETGQRAVSAQPQWNSVFT